MDPQAGPRPNIPMGKGSKYPVFDNRILAPIKAAVNVGKQWNPLSFPKAADVEAAHAQTAHA
jgi:hypothetical protein